MKLLDYLIPMKNLPNRFSNLAFWRILRIFKDDVVDAFTYLHTWGNDIEGEQATQDDTISLHEGKLFMHDAMIESLLSEQSSQNDRILSLELAESTSSGKVSDLEESVKTLNTALESVEKEQITQNTNIDAVNTNLDTIIPLVYDQKVANFKVSAYTDTNATVKQLAGALYVVSTTTAGLDFPSVPFHVASRASIVVYTNEAKTSYVTINVPMTHIISMSSGKTRIIWQPTPFYAPYGIDRLTGMYTTYISHI